MGDSRVGEVLAGKYRLDAELGRGGMGAVYRAFHTGVHSWLVGLQPAFLSTELEADNTALILPFSFGYRSE